MVEEVLIFCWILQRTENSDNSYVTLIYLQVEEEKSSTKEQANVVEVCPLLPSLWFLISSSCVQSISVN
jgi:hypothetical protein